MTTELNKQSLQNAYLSMRRIREFEERLHVEFATGEIPGFVHLYAGEEASATGVIMHLRSEDYLASTHRGHGHCIAKGLDVRTMMAEIYGKKPGICGGKGGSMHVADLHLGMMGANGIVGGGGPLICGAALAAKNQADRQHRRLLFWRWRFQSGNHSRISQPRFGVASSSSLRGRKQWLRGVDRGTLVGRHWKYCGSSRGL